MHSLTPKKGRVLIAEPSILDNPSFNRSVILLTEHNEKNTVGFILNKPLDYSLKDLIPTSNCDFQIFQGGPVEQDSLYFIHKLPELIPKSIEIGEGMYWGGNFETLSELLEKNRIPKEKIRFFLGYSGWGAQQLEEELKTNSWFCVENDFANIFRANSSSFWKKYLLKIGGKYKLWANAPSDPNLN